MNPIIRCFRCREWKDENQISRDGYDLHHRGTLDTIIFGWTPICHNCSTRTGKITSFFIRILSYVYGKTYGAYKLKRILKRKPPC